MALDLVLLDAGNTVIFLDHEAVADIVTSHGHPTDARVLRQVEGVAKRRYETLLRAGVSHEEGWGLYLRALLEEAGLGAATAREMVVPLRRAHDAFNLWRSVPSALPHALARLRAAGLRVGIVSNSEGKLPDVFARVGLGDAFEIIVDSHHEGVRKPDPEIFRRALARLRVEASRAIYLGDIPGIDVDGARAAGLDAVLVDALDFYPDHADSLRVRSVAEWVDHHLGPETPSRT
ncbi:MAG: HAD family hydrolase [Sandaracinaceae bacterium]|nr:HAD family hydrolase [Sandaracinaceae bacterium]